MIMMIMTKIMLKMMTMTTTMMMTMTMITTAEMMIISPWSSCGDEDDDDDDDDDKDQNDGIIIYRRAVCSLYLQYCHNLNRSQY